MGGLIANLGTYLLITVFSAEIRLIGVRDYFATKATQQSPTVFSIIMQLIMVGECMTIEGLQ